MAAIKLIKQLFTMMDAKAVAIFEREQACKNGRSFKKVDIVWAIELYMANPSMFGKMGKPLDEHFVVIVYYSKKDKNVKENRFNNEKTISMKTKRSKVIVDLKTFTVIKYVSRVVKDEIVKVIERYVVSDKEIKQNSIIPLNSPQLKAS